jgi:hypothetical protein
MPDLIKKILSRGSIFLLSLLLVSCSHPGPDLDREKKEILKLEADQQSYHLTRNPALFTRLFSDHFLSISHGTVDSPSRAESFEKFDRYFKKVHFIAWDNLQEPVIRFSDDGSVAYAAVQKKVIVAFKGDDGNPVQDTTVFAWLTVYKREPGGWTIDCVTSTNK